MSSLYNFSYYQHARCNASLREGYLPPIWKSAEVVPVPKVHPPTSICNDLRPISLLPTIAKVFESIIGKWFLTFIERRISITASLAVVSRGQPRMLSLPSSTLGWLPLIHMAQFAVFFLWIFEKPLIWWITTYSSLSKYNIPIFLLLWFASYLTNRQQRVRVNSSVSTFKNLKGAMPQGSWLGPL